MYTRTSFERKPDRRTEEVIILIYFLPLPFFFSLKRFRFMLATVGRVRSKYRVDEKWWELHYSVDGDGRQLWPGRVACTQARAGAWARTVVRTRCI